MTSIPLLGTWGDLSVKHLLLFLGHFLFPALLQTHVASPARFPSIPGCGLYLLADKTIVKVFS